MEDLFEKEEMVGSTETGGRAKVEEVEEVALEETEVEEAVVVEEEKIDLGGTK